MTQIHDVILEYWPFVGVAAALIVVAILWLILGRTQRIDLPPPTLDDPAPRATLSRPAPQAPSVNPPVAPLSGTTVPEPVTVDLTRLKGVGPKLAATLATLGVTSVAQIAGLDAGKSAAIDAQLGAFKGRLARDRVVEQAQLLTAGDITAYEARFGRIGSGVPPA